MIVVKHELRQGKTAFVIWTIAIAFLLSVCVLLFPEIKGEAEAVGDVFSSMGSFTAAFGMDRLDFGTLTGFYAVECGNVLGLGGAFFASLIGIAVLAKEEKGRTAEFLLTHPISRARVITEKLAAVIAQVVVMNLVILGCSFLSMAVIGEQIPWKEVLLMHFAYFVLQLELAGICFGISAFLCRGSIGIGLGLAALTYVLNLIANMTERAAFLKYITPFGYCEGADIVADGRLAAAKIVLGMLFACTGIAAAYIRYCRKDIR